MTHQDECEHTHTGIFITKQNAACISQPHTSPTHHAPDPHKTDTKTSILYSYRRLFQSRDAPSESSGHGPQDVLSMHDMRSLAQRHTVMRQTCVGGSDAQDGQIRTQQLSMHIIPSHLHVGYGCTPSCSAWVYSTFYCACEWFIVYHRKNLYRVME